MAEFIESIGFLLLISGALLAVLSHVLLMAGAREANPMWALVARIPLGNYVYVATHWDDAKFPFCVHLGGTSMVVAGAFMIGGEVRDSVLEMTGFKSEEEEVSPYDESWGEGGFDTADDWSGMNAAAYPPAAEPESSAIAEPATESSRADRYNAMSPVQPSEGEAPAADRFSARARLAESEPKTENKPAAEANAAEPAAEPAAESGATEAPEPAPVSEPEPQKPAAPTGFQVARNLSDQVDEALAEGDLESAVSYAEAAQTRYLRTLGPNHPITEKAKSRATELKKQLSDRLLSVP